MAQANPPSVHWLEGSGGKSDDYGTVEISTADEYIFSKYPIVS